ncbi:MAG: hypothetical protein ACOYJA_06775 [Christensenellales bacterium]|jgi:hypothetical protein
MDQPLDLQVKRFENLYALASGSYCREGDFAPAVATLAAARNLEQGKREILNWVVQPLEQFEALMAQREGWQDSQSVAARQALAQMRQQYQQFCRGVEEAVEQARLERKKRRRSTLLCAGALALSGALLLVIGSVGMRVAGGVLAAAGLAVGVATLCHRPE